LRNVWARALTVEGRLTKVTVVTPASAAPAVPAVDETMVRAVPKAEVHVHLEGCAERVAERSQAEPAATA